MKLRLDHPLVSKLAPAVVHGLVRMWLGSCRLIKVVDERSRALMESPAPVLFTSWHCHLLTSTYLYQKLYARYAPMALMASPSRDGEFIAAVTRKMGFATCPGSRRKGGVAALQALAGFMGQGYRAGLIADGSRGPVRVAQKGVVFLAREAQVPILPAAVGASRKITFNTWDRFEMPLPFARYVMLIDAPLYVPADARGPALERLRQELEDRLNRLFEQSQTYFSH
jgi:hypothetical protein